jgi:hypothetical protein
MNPARAKTARSYRFGVRRGNVSSPKLPDGPIRAAAARLSVPGEAQADPSTGPFHATLAIRFLGKSWALNAAR